jgi:hypothetical protein
MELRILGSGLWMSGENMSIFALVGYGAQGSFLYLPVSNYFKNGKQLIF